MCCVRVYVNSSINTTLQTGFITQLWSAFHSLTYFQELTPKNALSWRSQDCQVSSQKLSPEKPPLPSSEPPTSNGPSSSSRRFLISDKRSNLRVSEWRSPSCRKLSRSIWRWRFRIKHLPRDVPSSWSKKRTDVLRQRSFCNRFRPRRRSDWTIFECRLTSSLFRRRWTSGNGSWPPLCHPTGPTSRIRWPSTSESPSAGPPKRLLCIRKKWDSSIRAQKLHSLFCVPIDYLLSTCISTISKFDTILWRSNF